MRKIYTEDLLICPDDVGYGGLSTKLWYAPASFFSKIVIPKGEDFEGVKKISEVALKLGKPLKSIDVFLEQNALTEKVSGGVRRWKQTSELSFSVLGMSAKNLGFATQMKNEALIFFVPDSNGKIWVFGTLQNSAFLTSYEGNSGRKWDDDNLLNFGFTAHSEIFLFEGDLENILTLGAFSSGFSNGFKK